MRNLVSKVRGRLQHGLALQELLDLLARRGFVFYPYIVFLEFSDSHFAKSSQLATLRTRQLTEDDAVQLAAIATRPQDTERIRDRLRRGNIGVGAFDGERLVSYTWCDLERFGGIGQKTPRRDLMHDEAYLYDAYTLPEYRGHALVPHLRSELYKLLAAIGRRRIYSVSLYFNRSARRFKAKLAARVIELRLSINLFDRFKRDLLLKCYTEATGK